MDGSRFSHLRLGCHLHLLNENGWNSKSLEVLISVVLILPMKSDEFEVQCKLSKQKVFISWMQTDEIFNNLSGSAGSLLRLGLNLWVFVFFRLLISLVITYFVREVLFSIRVEFLLLKVD